METPAQFLAGAQGEDQYFAMMFKKVDRLDPLERKTIYRQLRDSITQTKTYLKALGAELKMARKEVQTRIKAKIQDVKQRQRALREQFQRDWQTLMREEKDAILQRKNELATIHDSGGNVAAALRARQKHLRDQQRALDELSGRADTRRKAYFRAREKEQESLDAVTTDLETAMPEALGWWAANRNSPTFSKKLPKKMSRTEFVLHWLHDHPEAVNDYRMQEAERKIAEHEKELEAKQKLIERKAHQRGTRRAMAQARGTGKTVAARVKRMPRDSSKYGGEAPF